MSYLLAGSSHSEGKRPGPIPLDCRTRIKVRSAFHLDAHPSLFRGRGQKDKGNNNDKGNGPRSRAAQRWKFSEQRLPRFKAQCSVGGEVTSYGNLVAPLADQPR
jgi:hypothetical protein